MSRSINLTILALAAAIIAGMLGCAACAEPEPKPKPVVAPLFEPCGTAGMKTVHRYLPDDNKKCAVVLLEKTAPELVWVGTNFEYQIKVTNVAKSPLEDVTVWDAIPDKFKMSKSTPEVSGNKGGWAMWKLGQLKSGESRTIKVEGMGTDVRTIKPCAEVTYRTSPLCININVVQPSLVLTKTAPTERLICDPITIKLLVKNVGNGQACNVMVRDPLPKGLTTMDGKDSLMFSAGTLRAGESREFTSQLKASAPGTYVNQAVATADGGLRSDAPPTTTVVHKPELSVTKTGPEMRYTNLPITYTITVSNGPDVTADNTVLTDTLPAGVMFISASEGGKMSDGKITWDLGTLAPRDTRKVTVTVKGTQAGELVNMVDVRASCGAAQTQMKTVVSGVSAILLETADDPDPIQIGDQTTYTISITNQGTGPDDNIVLTVSLPDQEQYVSSDGPTKGNVSGQEIKFDPIQSLAPKAKVTYKVVIKGTSPGDVHFKAVLNSNTLQGPVEHQESTHIYD